MEDCRPISDIPILILHYDENRGWGWVGVMVFNAILNNISVISWRSVLLVE